MKHFLFLICFLFVLAQCSKSEGNKDWTLNANSVELHRGETFLLTATQANVSFESSNQFVCGVSTSGTITGYHIGEAYINVTDGIKTYSCKVTVSPKYDMYTEPVVDWTLDRDGVKARYPNVTSWYTNKANAMHFESYLYNTESPSLFYIDFNFDKNTGKLSYVDVVFYGRYLQNAINFLEERYNAMYTFSAGLTILPYINALLTTEATVRVELFQATARTLLPHKVGEDYIIRYYNPKTISF